MTCKDVGMSARRVSMAPHPWQVRWRDARCAHRARNWSLTEQEVLADEVSGLARDQSVTDGAVDHQQNVREGSACRPEDSHAVEFDQEEARQELPSLCLGEPELPTTAHQSLLDNAHQLLDVDLFTEIEVFTEIEGVVFIEGDGDVTPIRVTRRRCGSSRRRWN